MSIVIEWANAVLTDAETSGKMIEGLIEQAEQLQANADNKTSFYPGFPIQVLICFDGARVSEQQILKVLPGAASRPGGALDFTLHDFPGSEYYQLKNKGAREASGDLLIFLDSDVMPGPGWLANIITTFSDPETQVVAGVSSIVAKGIYSKAMALNWIFPLAPDWDNTRTTDRFWANNVGFRSNLFMEQPFPRIDGASRGACSLLARRLREQGIPIHINGKARVTHPCPPFFERAMAQGRDRVLWHRHFSNWWVQSIPAGIARYGKHLLRVLVNTFTNRRSAGVRFWELPAVLAISAGYYTIFLVGELMTHLAPDWMKRSFRV